MCSLRVWVVIAIQHALGTGRWLPVPMTSRFWRQRCYRGFFLGWSHWSFAWLSLVSYRNMSRWRFDGRYVIAARLGTVTAAWVVRGGRRRVRSGRPRARRTTPTIATAAAVVCWPAGPHRRWARWPRERWTLRRWNRTSYTFAGDDHRALFRGRPSVRKSREATAMCRTGAARSGYTAFLPFWPFSLEGWIPSQLLRFDFQWPMASDPAIYIAFATFGRFAIAPG